MPVLCLCVQLNVRLLFNKMVNKLQVCLQRDARFNVFHIMLLSKGETWSFQMFSALSTFSLTQGFKSNLRGVKRNFSF